MNPCSIHERSPYQSASPPFAARSVKISHGSSCPGPHQANSVARTCRPGVEKAVPRPALISAEQAARAGIQGLEAGRRVVVPGLPMRAAMLASRYVPHAFKLPALEWVMRR